MRITFALLVSALLFVSCATSDAKMRKITDKVYIGMPLHEFNEMDTNKELVEMKNGVTIYKIETKDTAGSKENKKTNVRYFYFRNGELFAVDQGKQGQHTSY